MAVGLGCLGCDQLTKELARSHLGAVPVSLAAGTVQLAVVENSGAFLSLGAALPETVRRIAFQGIVPLGLLCLCVVFLRQAALAPGEALGMALVAGGGAGNWLDRVLGDGRVTDFVRLGAGPVHTGVFNAADVAVLCGIVVLLATTRRWSRRAAG